MYIPDFGPETPGQDDLWIHLNNGIKLSDGFIQTVYIAISRQRYRLSSSNTAHVGLRDNVLAAWMGGTVDPAARPTQHYLFIRRCICIGYPFKSISAFPLRILVSLCPKIVDLHRNGPLTRMGAYTYQGVWARPAEDGFPFSRA